MNIIGSFNSVLSDLTDFYVCLDMSTFSIFLHLVLTDDRLLLDMRILHIKIKHIYLTKVSLDFVNQIESLVTVTDRK